jgi:hypothetical protein
MTSCKLIIRAVGVMSDFAHLTVCNGFLEDIAKGYEHLELDLPQGLYSITLKLDGHIIKKNIRLDNDSEHTMKTPPVYSSLVAEQFESSYDYYKQNAVRYSKEQTASLDADGGGLFLFFRYSDFVCSQEFNKERKSLGDGFSLLDCNRKVLYRLQGSNIREDLYNGWMAFNAVLSAGTYYLNYDGVREIPLQVFSDQWQTQVFLTFGKTPIFPSMSILIAPAHEGFITNDENNYEIDGIRHKFHNGVYYIPEKALQEFKQGQFDSPMKALLAAYVYFSNPEVIDDQLFRNIIPQLAEILGRNSPDIKALQVLAAQYYKETLPDMEISEPGMFLAGVRAVIKGSIKEDKLIPDDSPMENITDNIYADMIWTSYVPAPLPSAIPVSIFSMVENIVADATSAEEIGQKLLSSQTVSTLLYYIEKLDNQIDVNDLATRLKIPPNVVRKTISHILSFSDSIKKPALLSILKDLNT